MIIRPRGFVVQARPCSEPPLRVPCWARALVRRRPGALAGDQPPTCSGARARFVATEGARDAQCPARRARPGPSDGREQVAHQGLVGQAQGARRLEEALDEANLHHPAHGARRRCLARCRRRIARGIHRATARARAALYRRSPRRRARGPRRAQGGALAKAGIGTLQVKVARLSARATRASPAALTVRGWPAPFSDGAARCSSRRIGATQRRRRRSPCLRSTAARSRRARSSALAQGSLRSRSARGRRACRAPCGAARSQPSAKIRKVRARLEQVEISGTDPCPAVGRRLSPARAYVAAIGRARGRRRGSRPGRPHPQRARSSSLCSGRASS